MAVGHVGRNEKMIKRIIYLRETHFSFPKNRSTCIDLLKQNGFQVEIWDLMPILHPEFLKNYTYPHSYQHDELTVFHDKQKAYQALSGLGESDFVINDVSYLYWNLGVYRALSRSEASYAVFYANAVPIYKDARKELFKKKFKLLFSFKRVNSKFLVLWKKLFMRLPFQWLGIRPAGLILAGGEECFSYRYPVDKHTKVLQIHASDYDLYLREREKPGTIKPTAVFIDEFLPFAHDSLFDGRGIPISAEKYYPLLNSFFDRVEEKTGLKVVIAAGPRSHYEDLPNYFHGRECVRGKTVDLIKESTLVLAHRSTAVSFANLYEKPVIFLTCSDLDKQCDGGEIKEMAKWFGKEPINMENSHDMNWKEELTVSKNHYDRYRRAYIKATGSPELPFWQVENKSSDTAKAKTGIRAG